MAARERWKGYTGGGLLGQKLLIFFFKFGFIRLGYAVMAAIVPFYMVFAKRGYKAIYHYFRKRHHYPPIKAFSKTYVNHFIFGQTILDKFAIFAGQNWFEVEIEGNEHFEKLAHSERSFVIANTHIGNAEAGGYMLNAKAKKINVLVYAGETRTIQTNRKRLLNQNNIELIPVKTDMSHLFAINDVLKRGEILSVFCDRTYKTDEKAGKVEVCDFLGGGAAFPTGTFDMAVRFDLEILALFTVKKSIRKYLIYICPLTKPQIDGKKEKTQSYVKQYVKELENVLEKYPEQWFNFYEYWNEDKL